MELAPDLPEQDWSRGLEDGSHSPKDSPRVLMKVYDLKQILLVKKLYTEKYSHMVRYSLRFHEILLIRPCPFQ